MPDTHLTTPNQRVPERVPECVPEAPRAPSETSASPSPSSPIGDALNEPSRVRPNECVPPPGFNPGTTWLLTPRTRPAWIALLDLLDDDQWHPTTDVAQAMKNAADLADRTIHNHLRSAGRRGWITTRRGRTRLRNRNHIEQALDLTNDQETRA